MSLDEYRRKRRPGRTPEPAGGEAQPAEGGLPVFVVQRHDARRPFGRNFPARILVVS